MDPGSKAYRIHTSRSLFVLLHEFSSCDSVCSGASHRSQSDGIRLGTFHRSSAGKKGALLHRRLVEVGQRGIAVRSLGGDRAGEMGFTRFLRNRKVTTQEIAAAAAAQTAGRVRGLHVLAIQDTTTARDRGRRDALDVHPTIAVDAETGAVLGLLRVDFLTRKGGLKERRKQRDFADKASRRWLDSAQAAADLSAAGALQVTVVADRESDIYELFALRPAETALLIRATQNRRVDEGGLLFDRLAGQPEAGRLEAVLPSAPGRKARKAVFAVRFCATEIKRPHDRAAGQLPGTVSVNVIEAREIDPPEGEGAALWRLITTHDVQSLEDAGYLIGLYRRRWTIEELFRTMKTRGFDIERVTIDEEPFAKLVCATVIAAISIMQLVTEREGKLKRPLEDVFHPDEKEALRAVCKTLEGKTARQKNPHPPDTLAYASWVCARLGGWTGYYGKPGPVVMLRGLHHFRALQHGWTIARDV